MMVLMLLVPAELLPEILLILQLLMLLEELLLEVVLGLVMLAVEVRSLGFCLRVIFLVSTEAHIRELLEKLVGRTLLRDLLVLGSFSSKNIG